MLVCKIVYYGPKLSGKKTNLQVVHGQIPVNDRTEIISVASDDGTTLFFDWMPKDKVIRARTTLNENPTALTVKIRLL